MSGERATVSNPSAQVRHDRAIAPPGRHADRRGPGDRDDEHADHAEQERLEDDQGLRPEGVRDRARRAAFPTKLPAIAAPVHSGNRRLAWRASKTDPAMVQAIVTPKAPTA